VLSSVNQYLLSMNQAEMFVTVLYGVFDRLTREFRYARAGHERPIVLDANGQPIDLVVKPGQILGVLPAPVLDEQHITLPTGGTLLMFTDGATEAMDADGQLFGLERLRTALQANHAGRAQSICAEIWRVVRLSAATGRRRMM
jgi:sigma-B regulation protein RsbU (phosphoserine phosphatase)